MQHAFRVALLLCCACAHAAPVLRFSEEGTFKIVQFTDLHYDGHPMGLDNVTSEVQASVLAAELRDPDGLGLVVYSGDMVSGFEAPKAPAVALEGDGTASAQGSWFTALWPQVVAPAEAAGVPHAIALGNHDTEAELDGRQVLQLDMSWSQLSLTQQGPPNITGASNYWLDVLNSTGDAVAARVWVLDSGSKGCEGVRHSWGCVGFDTLDWLVEQAAALPEVPTQLAYFHIPPPDMVQVWASQPTWGFKGEGSSCPRVDTGVLQALREACIQAAWVGHDHNNCFYGSLQGVRLGYGRKSGMGNYGLPVGVQQGARVVLLRQGESAAESETWIRTVRRPQCTAGTAGTADAGTAYRPAACCSCASASLRLHCRCGGQQPSRTWDNAQILGPPAVPLLAGEM